jgi:hydroxymethylpyrimidine pyrophosphatase-like HAD family hydrolase
VTTQPFRREFAGDRPASPGHEPRRTLDPHWRPKLVALDLDGTVVAYGAAGLMPTPTVVAAVRRVLDAGVPVVIATGRAAADAVDTALALGLHGVDLVCTNGAVVYDSDAAAVRHRVTVDVADAARALALALPEAAFAVERDPYGFVVTEGFHADFTMGSVEVADLETLIAEPVVRMVCVAPGESLERMAAVAVSALDPDRYGWDLGYSAWLDVMAPGVSKATGATMICADLGVDAADVLAVGDGTNDVELFAWAGWSVAMGQAPQVVRDAADEVGDSVDVDGCATVLARWFP